MQSVTTQFWSEIESRPWGGDTEEAKSKHKKWFPNCANESPFIDDLLDPENPYNLLGKKFIDLGCGNGAMIFRLVAIHGCSLKAFDLPFMEPFIRHSFFSGRQIEDLSSVNVEFISGDITTHSKYAPDNSIDCVIANNVLPYINHTKLRKTFEKVLRCLSINGIFLFSVFTRPTLTAMDLIHAESSGTMIYRAPNHNKFIHQMYHYLGLSVMSIIAQKPPYDHTKYVQAIKLDRVVLSSTSKEPKAPSDPDDQKAAAFLKRSVRIAIKNEQT